MHSATFLEIAWREKRSDEAEEHLFNWIDNFYIFNDNTQVVYSFNKEHSLQLSYSYCFSCILIVIVIEDVDYAEVFFFIIFFILLLFFNSW
jgi:hypothetical protein